MVWWPSSAYGLSLRPSTTLLRAESLNARVTTSSVSFQDWHCFISNRFQANYCLESGVSASKTLGSAAFIRYGCDDDFTRLLAQNAINTADLAAECSKLLDHASLEHLSAALNRAEGIDLELERWTKLVPGHWKFCKRYSSAWPNALAYQGRCDTYYDVQIASNWNSYRRVRLILLECIFRLVRAINLLSDADHAQLEVRVLHLTRDIAEDVCGSIPFHLGTRSCSNEDISFPLSGDAEADAIHHQSAAITGWFFAVLPITRLMKCELILSKQHTWISAQYQRVCAIAARKHGISVARVAHIFQTAVPAFASSLPNNSKHIR